MAQGSEIDRMKIYGTGEEESKERQGRRKRDASGGGERNGLDDGCDYARVGRPDLHKTVSEVLASDRATHARSSMLLAWVKAYFSPILTNSSIRS